MTRPVAVLRPEPGNAATVERLRAAGIPSIALPLFEVRPLSWGPIDPAAHDGLVITSANTLRHGGEALDGLRCLPVFAVGKATADAASAAGFEVLATGERDAAAILATARRHGFMHLLLLGGRERSVDTGGIVVRAVAVYASEPITVPTADFQRLAGSVALLHSARAALRLGMVLDAAGIARAGIRIAALSDAVANAAGPGWHHIVVATRPTDPALIAAARTLVD